MCQQGKVRTAMQRGVVECVKHVDANVDASAVLGEQLASVERFCEETGNGSDVMRMGGVIKVAKTVFDYKAIATALRMPVWSESSNGMGNVLSTIPLTQCDVDKGACVVQGRGVEAYVSSSEDRFGDEQNKAQVSCVSSGGMLVPYISESDVDLECVGNGGCFGECVKCAVVGPGVIEMVYQVEGTGELQLTVKVLGEVVLVSI